MASPAPRHQLFTQRLADPDRPRLAVAALVLASGLLLVAVLLAVPTAAEGTDDPVAADPGTTTTSELLSGPGQVVLPVPRGDTHETTALVNHRRGGVDVDVQVVNGEGLVVELAEAGLRATRVRVASEAIHRCGRYAGTLVVQARHTTLPGDHLVLEVRYASCDDAGATALAAPDSVHRVEPTWGEEGRAPWAPVPVVSSPSPTATPSPTPTAAAGPGSTPETTSPTATSEPAPTADPTPAPTADPTSTGEPTADPSPTADPTTTSTPTSTSAPTPSPTDDAPPSPTSDPSPSPSPTTDAGGDTADGGASPTPTASST